MRNSALTGGDLPGASGPPPDRLFAGVVQPGGGLVAPVPGTVGDVAVTSISVPSGALSKATAVTFGVATVPIDPPRPDLDARGPTIVFGPSGLEFEVPATITLPIDTRGYEDNLGVFEVFQRDEDGTVSPVPPPYTVDAVAGTISFAVDHFTSFRVFAPGLVPQFSGETHIEPLTAANNDGIGQAVAIDGDTLAVGAPGTDTVAGQAGAVHVYVRVSGVWEFQQTVLPTVVQGSQRFGHAVALSGDTLYVGAPGQIAAGATEGSLSVFTRAGATWSLRERLTVGQAGNGFGTSLDLDGALLAVGAPNENIEAESDAGAAYVYDDSSGSLLLVDRVQQPTATAAQEFGSAVALAGGTLAVGARGFFVPGRAFVFEDTVGDYEFDEELVPGSATVDDYGASIAIGGYATVIVVGDDANDGEDISTPVNSGRAWVFAPSGSAWTVEKELVAPEGPEAQGRFGASVAAHRNLVLIGHSGHSLTRGEVVAWFRPDSTYTTFAASSPAGLGPGEAYGRSIALSGTDIAVGAPTISSLETGSAYVHTVELEVESE